MAQAQTAPLEIHLEPSTPLTPEAFCRDYGPQVFRFAAVVSKGAHDAEDLAQGSLLKALMHLDQFDSRKGNVEAWLWRIVVNHHRDHQRGLDRARRLIEDWARVGDHGPSVEDVVLERLRDEQVRNALQRLGRRDRQLLALKFSVDLETKAVAEVMGLNHDATTKAIRRALLRLRRVLSDD